MFRDRHNFIGGQLLALFIDPDIASPRGDKHKGDQGDDENEAA